MILPYVGRGYCGRCLYDVTSLKASHRLTRVTGSSSLYQHIFCANAALCYKRRQAKKTKTTGDL